MRFGEKIKQLRKEKELLQRQPVVSLDVDTPNYIKEKRKRVTPLTHLLDANEELLTIRLSDKIIENIGDESTALVAIKYAEQELKKNFKL